MTKREALIHAIAHFTAAYHSGQWSRGYRLWCRAATWLARQGIDFPLDWPMCAEAQAIYDTLVTRYAGKV